LIPVASQALNLHHALMPQAPKGSPPTEVLAGLVERVTFHNEENGFCVLRVKARGQRDQITVLGHAAMISAGEFVHASGTWINDRTHGVQFRASFLKATAPTTVEGIEKYLGSGMIRGIGPVFPTSSVLSMRPSSILASRSQSR
jgi:exodeoxyribonuclease V alpha subunit